MQAPAGSRNKGNFCRDLKSLIPRRISAGASRIDLLICPLYGYMGPGELAAPSLATP